MAVLKGELISVVTQFTELAGGYSLYLVAVTGVISFIITLFTLQATRFATPLTIAVLSNLKQVCKK